MLADYVGNMFLWNGGICLNVHTALQTANRDVFLFLLGWNCIFKYYLDKLRDSNFLILTTSVMLLVKTRMEATV
jgi:hypothetical protein